MKFFENNRTLNRAASNTQNNSIKVLHVDDDVKLLEYTKILLEKADDKLIVESVNSPEKALEMYEGYDCIVSDFQMPIMNGIELATKVRKKSEIPFILYTGKESEEVAIEAFRAGVDDYIRKEIVPSHYQILLKRIRTAVDKYRAEKELHEREFDLSRMVETSLDAIFRIELEKGITRYNPAFINIFGYSPEEIENMGVGMLDLIHNEDRETFWAEVRELSSSKITKYVSLNRWYTKCGDVISLESNVSALVVDGRFIGVEIVSRDITERL